MAELLLGEGFHWIASRGRLRETVGQGGPVERRNTMNDESGGARGGGRQNQWESYDKKESVTRGDRIESPRGHWIRSEDAARKTSHTQKKTQNRTGNNKQQTEQLRDIGFGHLAAMCITHCVCALALFGASL